MSKHAMALFFVVLICASDSFADVADHPAKNGQPAPLLVASLDKQLDGKEVTIEFTVEGVNHVSQLFKPGQAPTFVIRAEPHEKKRLSVWVVGELANVLDRLQMAIAQDNRVQPGTVIQATGTLKVHTMDSDLFLIDITQWENFKILPRPKKHDVPK